MIAWIPAFPFLLFRKGGDVIGDVQFIDVDQGECFEMIISHLEAFVTALDIAEGVAFSGKIKGQISFLEFKDLIFTEQAYLQPLSVEGIPDPEDLLRKGPKVFWVMLKKTPSGLLTGDGQIGRQREIGSSLEMLKISLL